MHIQKVAKNLVSCRQNLVSFKVWIPKECCLTLTPYMTESLDFYKMLKCFTSHKYHSQKTFKAVPTGTSFYSIFMSYENSGRGNVFIWKQVNCTKY